MEGKKQISAEICLLLTTFAPFLAEVRGQLTPGPDFYISLIMGVFTIGLGIALVTWATPFLPAAEVSILVLLESILGPVWVWLFLGEIISFAELIGGFTVISAVILMVYKSRSV